MSATQTRAQPGGDSGQVRSYHGQPVLKEPVWTWEIPIYFFSGGLAGGSAGLALLAEWRGNDLLGRRAWAVALLGITVSPMMLISDLGKPSRFLNMLRMFKVTSPMSVGSWILSFSGATTALAAANAWTGVFPRLGRAAKPAAALSGLPLSTYTAALIANTAVPVWHEARHELPFVFGAGAGLSAGAAALIATPPQHAAAARRLALGGAVAELASERVMEKRLGELAAAYEEKIPSTLKRISQVCVAAGALISTRARSSRPAAVAAGILLGAGALAMRWSIFRAGFASVSDPKYVVAPQRAQIRDGLRAGAARTEARVAAHGPARGSPATTLG